MGLVGTEHAVHHREAEIVGSAEATAVGVDAVEHNRGWFTVVNSQVDDPLRVNGATAIIAWLAADKSNMAGIKIIDSRGIGQHQGTLDNYLLRGQSATMGCTAQIDRSHLLGVD